jgi:succinyl-CoA synthetase alpha subunit
MLQPAKSKCFGSLGIYSYCMVGTGIGHIPLDEIRSALKCGDPIIGTTTKEAVELFMNDPDTDAIVMIGEIGGNLEADAARWIKASGNKKPVIGFIAGQTAPAGRRMGHAGAIIGGAEDTAAAKMAIMRECGIIVVDSPASIGDTVAKVLGAKAGK